MVKVRENLIGKQFGLLTVLQQVDDYISPKGRHYDRWLCQCKCGNKIAVVGHHLKEKDKIKSCGCYTNNRIKQEHKKYNTYDLESHEYGIGYTSKEEEFWFDKEDYDLIKNYCWYYNNYGYLVACDENHELIKFHRLVMQAQDMDVDHKNHPPRNEHKKDNRKSNLQFVNDSQNSMNRSLRSDNKSGVTGVYWDKRSNQWISNIFINGKRIYLGSFTNFDEAVKSRKAAEIKYFGKYRYCANN